jgi:hypothetical protein
MRPHHFDNHWQIYRLLHGQFDYDPFPNAKIATYVDYKDTIEEAVEGADSATTRPIRPVPITATFKSLMDFDKIVGSQAINVVRHFNQIQTKVREHDFRWEPTILSKSIKDLTFKSLMDFDKIVGSHLKSCSRTFV